MEPNALQFAERLEAAARSFRRTRLWMLAVTLVALAGIVCYAVFGHDRPVCFGVLVLSIRRLSATNGRWGINRVRRLARIPR